MSHTDRPTHGKPGPDADLGDAIHQLEKLLHTQTQTESFATGAGDNEALPILDDVVDDASGDEDIVVNDKADDIDIVAAPLSHNTDTRPDPQAIRKLLDQLAAQMETELETVVDMLKHSVLQEFKTELAAALKIDPLQLDSTSGIDSDSVGDDPSIR